MAKEFLVETSARHVHVTQETLEKLFGEGYQLTVKKELSQPGQYASNERVTVVGPKKELANVSILGPCRKLNQVELSATDARSIGINAPIRESGDVKGSAGCKLVGPKGEVELEEGDKGDTGPMGPQGPQGEKGADGTLTFEDLTEEQKNEKKVSAPWGILIFCGVLALIIIALIIVIVNL